jgi:hypothetical protein
MGLEEEVVGGEAPDDVLGRLQAVDPHHQRPVAGHLGEPGRGRLRLGGGGCLGQVGRIRPESGDEGCRHGG